MEKFPNDCLIPVRSSMAYLFEAKERLYLFGGCRDYRDHIKDVQVYDFKKQTWELAAFKLIKNRSCFMMSNIGSHVYIMGGYDGYECLRDVERIDMSQESPKFEKMKDLCCPLKNSVSFMRDDQFYLVGGWDEKETQDKIYKYDPST